MTGVIKADPWHPSINQDRLGDYGRCIRDRLYLMTKCASGKVGTDIGRHLALWPVRIGCEKNCTLQFIAGTELLTQLLNLLGNKSLNIAIARPSLL